jgi:hypothetical protein
VYAGIPAKKKRKIDPELEKVFDRTANNYIRYAEWFK